MVLLNSQLPIHDIGEHRTSSLKNPPKKLGWKHGTTTPFPIPLRILLGLIIAYGLKQIQVIWLDAADELQKG